MIWVNLLIVIHSVYHNKQSSSYKQQIIIYINLFQHEVNSNFFNLLFQKDNIYFAYQLSVTTNLFHLSILDHSICIPETKAVQILYSKTHQSWDFKYVFPNLICYCCAHIGGDVQQSHSPQLQQGASSSITQLDKQDELRNI